MLFSILIPAYKTAFLKECLASCLAQDFGDYEVIVVDDCSPENVKDVVDKCCDEKIRYFRNEQNCGAKNVVDNWNICLNYAIGEWVVCMGDDDVLMPNFLSEYVALIKKYPEVDLLHSRVRQIDENGSLIHILQERCEKESCYSHIYGRMQMRAQYIGDFCFRRRRLLAEGGFYKLPFAWGSDDVSAFICSFPNGVANTNVPTFCYRINSLTISNSGNEEEKFIAIQKEEQWLRNFVSNQEVENELSRCELSDLRKSISWGMDKARYWIVYYALKRNCFSLIKWMLCRKKYDVPTKAIVRAAYDVLIKKRLGG